MVYDYTPPYSGLYGGVERAGPEGRSPARRQGHVRLSM